jgi:sec-independent protein translocase protein TatC
MLVAVLVPEAARRTTAATLAFGGFVGAFVVAAVLTPPDVMSQMMLALPMCVLYEVGIIAARALARRPDAGEAEQPPA